MSADIFCRCDATIDQLIDVIEVNLYSIVFMKCIINSIFLGQQKIHSCHLCPEQD